MSCFPCPWRMVSPAQPTPYNSLTPEREQDLVEGVFKNPQEPSLLLAGCTKSRPSLPSSTLGPPQQHREVIPSKAGAQRRPSNLLL